MADNDPAFSKPHAASGTKGGGTAPSGRTLSGLYAHSNHDTKARAVAKLPTSDKVVTQVPRKAKKPKAA